MEDLRWVEMFSWVSWQEGELRKGSERVTFSCRVAHKYPHKRMLSSEEAAGSRWSPGFRPSLQLRSVKPNCSFSPSSHPPPWLPGQQYNNNITNSVAPCVDAIWTRLLPATLKEGGGGYFHSSTPEMVIKHKSEKKKPHRQHALMWGEAGVFES